MRLGNDQGHGSNVGDGVGGPGVGDGVGGPGGSDGVIVGELVGALVVQFPQVRGHILHPFSLHLAPPQVPSPNSRLKSVHIRL